MPVERKAEGSVMEQASVWASARRLRRKCWRGGFVDGEGMEMLLLLVMVAVLAAVAVVEAEVESEVEAEVEVGIWVGAEVEVDDIGLAAARIGFAGRRLGGR